MHLLQQELAVHLLQQELAAHLLQQELVGIAMKYFVLQLELEVLAESAMFVTLELHSEQNKIIYLHTEIKINKYQDLERVCVSIFLLTIVLLPQEF